MPRLRQAKPIQPELRAVFPDQRPDHGGIIVRSLAVREWMPPCLVERPLGRPDWLVVAFAHEVELGTCDGPTTAPAGSVVVWRPGMAQRYGAPGREWLHSWIHLQGEGVARFAAAAGLACGRPLPRQDLARFDAGLREVAAELVRPRPDPLLLGDLVRLPLRRIARDSRDLAGDGVPPALLAVRRHLAERFAEPLGLAGLARMAGLSPGHLCTAFRRCFGVPPMELLLRLRVAHARELLADPGCSIAAAARQVGYHDPRTFARLVRRRLGHPAGALRPTPYPRPPRP